MGATHYFQRYSKPENWLTNSTLLLFQYLYNHDSKRFEDFLEGLIGSEENISISIGPDFEQQVREYSSVPDGHIYQKGFRILIEAKPHGELREGQLLDHIEAFTDNNSERILLALTKEKVSEASSKTIKSKIKERYPQKSTNVNFATVTYEEIILNFEEVLHEHELTMKEIIADYDSLCQEKGVISLEKYRMLVAPTGDSYQENRKYDVYYDPIDRTHTRNFKYLGLYKNKAIRGVGEVKYIVACNLINGKLTAAEGYEEVFENLSDENKMAIIGIIRNTDYYDLSRGKRFFVVDKFHDTNFLKVSHGGLRKKKYMLLKEIDGFDVEISSQKLADLLGGKQWN
ncbi:hypothetical protein CK503_11195 [Aliifodinibius salipaludis]|uniref:Uncharacterized protein n=1 Tax=Fodinibius salipaludis TaxID=2032627 RepID=A0A2A2GA30_9BACT|nr:hypothetical protein [Aliifodinibius salipaludis]PAU93709.1 hypothetical protein CK503_11195 [Aliifodinibius salipaludis]